MPSAPVTRPLLRLGRLELDPALRAFQPGLAAPGLAVTATVEVPESVSERQYAWDVAWADAVREAGQLGADERTAQALATGAGKAAAAGARVVVAAHGEVLLARWLPPGAAAGSVRAGPLPHLREAAAAAARRPAHVVLLADRDSAAIVAHAAGDQRPARRFPVAVRPGAPRDPHPGRPSPSHPARCPGTATSGSAPRSPPRWTRSRYRPAGRPACRRAAAPRAWPMTQDSGRERRTTSLADRRRECYALARLIAEVRTGKPGS